MLGSCLRNSEIVRSNPSIRSLSPLLRMHQFEFWKLTHQKNSWVSSGSGNLRMFTTGKAHFGVGAGIPLDWFWRARMVAAVERGGSRTGGRSAQGDGSVGTIASKMG